MKLRVAARATSSRGRAAWQCRMQSTAVKRGRSQGLAMQSPFSADGARLTLLAPHAVARAEMQVRGAASALAPLMPCPSHRIQHSRHLASAAPPPALLRMISCRHKCSASRLRGLHTVMQQASGACVGRTPDAGCSAAVHACNLQQCAQRVPSRPGSHKAAAPLLAPIIITVATTVSGRS